MHFQRSDYSIGAEYELQLLDCDSLDLADDIDALLAVCPNRRHVTAEYFKPTVEIVSRVCANVGELERHLKDQVAMLEEAADKVGLRLAGAGTHPFSSREVEVNAGPRYQKVRRITGKISLLQVTYGLHVHLGMPSAETAIRVMNRLRPYLPLLLALSANSPYWRGLDSGFASYRQRMLMTLHAFGMPPRFADWESFERMTRVTRRAGVFDSYKDMHWDLRPRPDFGTLEIRVMDAQPGVRDTAALAALCHALGLYLMEAENDPPLLPELPAYLETENHYRASLDAMDCSFIVDADGGLRPARELAEELLERIEPLAPRLRCEEQLAEIRERLRRGVPAQRQRELADAGSLAGVVADLAERLSAEVRILH